MTCFLLLLFFYVLDGLFAIVSIVWSLRVARSY